MGLFDRLKSQPSQPGASELRKLKSLLSSLPAQLHQQVGTGAPPDFIAVNINWVNRKAAELAPAWSAAVEANGATTVTEMARRYREKTSKLRPEPDARRSATEAYDRIISILAAST